MKKSYIFCFFLILGWMQNACLVAQIRDPTSIPWEMHGSLQVSENGHYLKHADGTPFLWLGGTVWGMSEWMTRADVDTYLDDRQTKGFSVIQICLLWGKRYEDPVRFYTNAPNAYGHRALQYSDSISDPSRPDTLSGGSPASPNDYWDHVAYILKAAAERGLYIALLPVWGRRYVNGAHPGFSKKLFDDNKARLYGNFLGRRYGNMPHVIWVMGGDTGATKGGDYRSVYRAMAEGIIEGITSKAARWNQPHTAWDAALMTYHPSGFPSKNSSTWFHQDPWLDFHMIETHIWRDSLYDAVLHDYLLTNPVKPTIMAEGHYEGNTDGQYADEAAIRRQAYHTFFAGAAGHTYGANRDNGNGPLFSPYEGWKTLLNHKGAQSMIPLRDLLTEHEWWKWKPDTNLIIGEAGKGEFKTVGVTVKSENKLLVYFPENEEVFLNLPTNFTSSKIQLTWFDPITSRYQSSTILTKGEKLKIRPPENRQEAVGILSLVE